MKKNNMNNPRNEGCKPGEACNPTKQSTQKSGQQGQQDYKKPFSGSQEKQTKSGFGQGQNGSMSNKNGMSGQQNKWKSEKEEDEDKFGNKGYGQGNSKK